VGSKDAGTARPRQWPVVSGCWSCAGLLERACMPGAGGRWDRSLQGSLTRPPPPPPPTTTPRPPDPGLPALPGLAELMRLRGKAWPAVCPGLSASREGAGSCNDGGGGPPPGRSRAGVAEDQPDVRSGLGECAGSVRRPPGAGAERSSLVY
jgi:hypothetical protein